MPGGGQAKRKKERKRKQLAKEQESSTSCRGGTSSTAQPDHVENEEARRSSNEAENVGVPHTTKPTTSTSSNKRGRKNSEKDRNMSSENSNSKDNPENPGRSEGKSREDGNNSDSNIKQDEPPVKGEKDHSHAQEQEHEDDDDTTADIDDSAPVRFLDLKTLNQYRDLILQDCFHHYYVSNDWSPEFYYALAFEGFISVSDAKYLIPEIQRSYCVLDWPNLHVGRKTRRLLKKGYKLYVNRDWDRCVRGITEYWGRKNWFNAKYAETVKKSAVKHHSIELYDENNDKLIAGECGYTIGSIYTSLTGFCDKTIPNCGNFQLYYLGKWLERSGYKFWNLGHPPRPDCMKYKADLGGRILKRPEFLVRWQEARAIEIKGLESGSEFDFSQE